MTLSPRERALIDPDGHFRQRLREDAVRLRQVQAAGQTSEAARLVHRLAGAAGTFGYDEIGAIAIALDDRFAETGILPDIEPLLQALRAV